MPIKQIIFTALKTLAVATCVVMACTRPPAKAQQTVQETQISELNQHLTHTDGIVDADAQRLRGVELQMSEMLGEERAAFLLLGLLSGGSLVLQVRVKRKEI